MSYIQEGLTKEDFIKSFGSKYQQVIKSALTCYHSFCQSKFGFSGDKVLEDLVVDCKETQNSDKIYSLFNQFVQFMQEDHPEIPIYWGFKQRTFKKKHPSTVSSYFKALSYYFEICGNFEFNQRKIKARIKLPKIPKEDPEPFTRSEIRELCDIATSKRKMIYMVLKDSGIRIGECMSLRKKDIDTDKDPLEIHLPANITKTKNPLKPGGSLITPDTIFVTTKKIIIRNPSALGLRQNVEIYPYEKIVDVKLEKGMFSSAIDINVPGSLYDGYIEAIPKNEAENLMKIIYEKIKGKKTSSSDDGPLTILKKRFAKGEITKEEYEDMKSVLE